MDPDILETVLYAGLYILGTLLTLGLGFLVVRVSPRGSDGRRVAAVLLAEGLALVLVMMSLATSRLAEGVGAFFRVGALTVMLALAPLELVMLGRVKSRATAWVRGREKWILAIPVVMGVLVVVESLVDASRSSPFARGGYVLFALFAAGYALMPFFALVVVIRAWRRATTAASRQRAKWFAVAFGARDAILIFFVVVMVLINWGPAAVRGGWLAYNTFTIPIFAVVVYTPLLAYGILKSRVFDIDLRVKRGFEAGTIGAFFVIAFFVAEQVGQQVMSQRAGPYVGFAGASALALAIMPLRRLARRIVKKAMPRVDGSLEYVASRKLLVYAAAAEEALADGVIDDRDRAILNRLATELLLSPKDMLAIEMEVAAGETAGPSRIREEPRPESFREALE